MHRNRGRGHDPPEPNAHGRDENLALPASELIQARCDLPGARCAERVAKCDGAAVDVDLCRVELELLQTVHVHARKSLVDLPKVDIGGREARALEHLWDGVRRPNAHDARGKAGNAGRDVLGDDAVA